MKYSDAERYIMAQDPVLGALIERLYPLELRPVREDYFASLSRSIVGQQISVKAAASVFGRLVKVTDLAPNKVARLNDEQVTTIGLSGQKRRYLQDLAEHFVRDPAVFNHLEGLSDEDVIKELTEIKGIGVWTAQMFLMFTLGRPDVFAPDDRGLQVAIQNVYKFKNLPSRSELSNLAERWSPYRTTASLYLWQSLHNTPQ